MPTIIANMPVCMLRYMQFYIHKYIEINIM